MHASVMTHSESWADDIDEEWEQILVKDDTRSREPSLQGPTGSGFSSPMMQRRSSMESFEAHAFGGAPSPSLCTSPQRTPSTARTPAAAAPTPPGTQPQHRHRQEHPAPPAVAAACPRAPDHYAPFPSCPTVDLAAAAAVAAHAQAHAELYEAYSAQAWEVEYPQYPFHVLPYAFAPVPHEPCYAVGQAVDVLRSDGNWTAATVARFAGDAYVVQITEQKTKTIPLRLVHKWLRPSCSAEDCYGPHGEWLPAQPQ